MWSLIGLAVSAIGVFVEYMGDKEEREEQDKEMNDLRDRIEKLENDRRNDNERR
ncbi:MAG: hypothetical protein J6U54_15980 [Clostridiales bacterium]|nr:hypothetical protein [Clostridiales bacterium]